MPITSGAKKAHRASLNKRVFSIRRNRAVTDTVKKVRTLITTDKLTEAEALMPTTQKAIDKATKRGIIKPNAANRTKARLAAAIVKAKK